MTTFEQVQRQLWDSLMDHERRVFFQLIQGELPNMTLRELGQILTSSVARSVGDLPANTLLALAPPASNSRQRRPSRRASTSHRSHVPAVEGSPVRRTRVAQGEGSKPTSRVVPPVEDPAPTPVLVAAALDSALSLSSAPEQSHVALIQNTMSRTLAGRSRQDADTQVITALRAVRGWIGARELRRHVALQPNDLRAVLNRLVKAGTVHREGEGPDTVYRLLEGSSLPSTVEPV